MIKSLKVKASKAADNITPNSIIQGNG